MTGTHDKVNISRNYNKFAAAGVLLCALSGSACSDGNANGKVDLIDMRSEQLLSTDLESVTARMVPAARTAPGIGASRSSRAPPWTTPSYRWSSTTPAAC